MKGIIEELELTVGERCFVSIGLDFDVYTRASLIRIFFYVTQKAATAINLFS